MATLMSTSLAGHHGYICVVLSCVPCVKLCWKAWTPLLWSSTVTLTSFYPLFLFCLLLSLLFFCYLLFFSFNLWCLRLAFLLKLANKPHPVCFLGTLPCLYTSFEEAMLFFLLNWGWHGSWGRQPHYFIFG